MKIIDNLRNHPQARDLDQTVLDIIEEMQERLTKLEISYYGHFHAGSIKRTTTPLNSRSSAPSTRDVKK